MAPGSSNAARGAFWTAEEEASLRTVWRDPAWKTSQIAESFRRTISAVQKKAWEMNLGARPRGGGTGWRTEARRELLRRDWPIGRPVHEILAEMVSMEGAAPSNARQISEWAGELRIRRPKGFVSHLFAKGLVQRKKKKNKVYTKRDAKVDPVLIDRFCLRCSVKFSAETRFLRLCLTCRKSDTAGL